MTLMTLTSGLALSATALNNNFNDQVVTILLNATSGLRDWQVDLAIPNSSYATGVTSSERRLDFILADDAELRSMSLTSSMAGGGDGGAVLASLTAINADEDTMSKYFLGTSLTASMGTGSYAGGVESRDYTSSTGTKHFLLKGITYRLALEEGGDGVSAGGWSHLNIILRARRRRA